MRLQILPQQMAPSTVLIRRGSKKVGHVLVLGPIYKGRGRSGEGLGSYRSRGMQPGYLGRPCPSSRWRCKGLRSVEPHKKVESEAGPLSPLHNPNRLATPVTG